MKEILGHKFYTLAEIAEKINETPQVIKGYLNSQKLNGQRIGRHFYVSELSLHKFLNPASPIVTDPEFTARVTAFLNRYKKKTSVEGKFFERYEDTVGWKDALEWKGPALQKALQNWLKAPTKEAKIVVLEAMIAILELRGAVPRAYSYHRGNYEKVYLKGADFSVLPLGGNFEKAYLEGANFRQAGFRFVHFRGAYLKGADFSQTVFHQADFRDANLIDTIFEAAKLGRSKFEGAIAYLSQKEAFSQVMSEEQINSIIWLDEKADQLEEEQPEIPEVIRQKCYSVPEIAEMLGITPQTVRHYIKKDKLKGCYRSREFYITEQSLRRFLYGSRYSTSTDQELESFAPSPWPGRDPGSQKFGNDDRLSLGEIAKFLRVTPDRVRNYIKQKKLKGKVRPRSFCVSEKSLWNFLHPNIPTTPDPEFTKRAGVFLNMLNLSTIINSELYITPPVAAYKLFPKMNEAFRRASRLEDELHNWIKAPTQQAKIGVLEAMITILEAFFLGEDFKEANFQGAYLKGANFREVNLEGANLQEANLEEANLEGANLKKANLKGSNLQKANLLGANFKEANLQGANLKGIDIEDGNIGFMGTNLEGVDFEGANLQWVGFIEANLKKANFQGADLNGVTFEESYLIDTNFQGANIKTTAFKGSLAYLSQKEALRKILSEEQINSMLWI